MMGMHKFYIETYEEAKEFIFDLTDEILKSELKPITQSQFVSMLHVIENNLTEIFEKLKEYE